MAVSGWLARAALRLDALVVTSDPQDLQHLAASLHSKLARYAVYEIYLKERAAEEKGPS